MTLEKITDFFSALPAQFCNIWHQHSCKNANTAGSNLKLPFKFSHIPSKMKNPDADLVIQDYYMPICNRSFLLVER